VFRDEVTINVIAGKGGDGLISFRREAHVPRGGPDGGDGGDGGSVVLCASSALNSLLSVGRHYRYAARNGQPGGPRKCGGRSADDLIVQVPIGTVVYDQERGNLLRDLAHEGQSIIVAQGGRGGRGNPHFASAVRQAPRIAKPGGAGEQRALRLELRLFAEVGLVGLPNAGKSTFLSAVTAARPKIADYPFTTLEPQVGIATVGDHDTLVLADLPGLIEGAAEGHGLGHRFLEHVARCRVLLHLVDTTGGLEEAVRALRTIDDEVRRFSTELAQKPRLIVASKCESAESEEVAVALEEASGEVVHRLSSVERHGLDELLQAAWDLVRGTPETA